MAFGSAWACGAQTTEVARVVDGTGGWMSNAALRVVSAVAQPGPVGGGTNAFRVNHSGFLNAFILAPEQDTDSDGVADENDPDDDNDGLTDLTELRGDAFAPVTPTDPLVADTDGDGLNDFQEFLAGTNPRDAASCLRILALEPETELLRITWQSRRGHLYALLAAASMAEIGNNAATVMTVTATSGTGPWEEGVTSGTDAPDAAGSPPM